MSGFTFADATAIVDYLAALGISHCYTSSYFKAVPGSPHGYDVADPDATQSRDRRRTRYTVWIDTLRAHEMGHIIDLVPNHMGIAKSANPWWQDVLENGESSRHAGRLRHRLAARSNRSWSTRSCFRCSAISTARCSSVRRSRSNMTDGAFRSDTSTTVFPIAPGTYDRDPRIAAPALLRDGRRIERGGDRVPQHPHGHPPPSGPAGGDDRAAHGARPRKRSDQAPARGADDSIAGGACAHPARGRVR